MNGSRLFSWCPSTEMYARPASYRDGSMLLIVPPLGNPGAAGVTSAQCAPSSRVTCTLPSFDPAQMSPRVSGDSAIAKSVQQYSTPRLSSVRPPELCMWAVSSVVRSGLMIVHVLPPSVVRCTYWLPTYTVLWSNGESASGCVQFQRYLALSAGESRERSGHGSTEKDCLERRSNFSRPPS